MVPNFVEFGAQLLGRREARQRYGADNVHDVAAGDAVPLGLGLCLDLGTAASECEDVAAAASAASMEPAAAAAAAAEGASRRLRRWPRPLAELGGGGGGEAGEHGKGHEAAPDAHRSVSTLV